MLRQYFIADDSLVVILQKLWDLGAYASSYLNNNHLLVRYSDNDELSIYNDIIIKHNSKDLGGVTIEQLEEKTGKLPILRRYFGSENENEK